MELSWYKMESVLSNRIVLHLGISKKISYCKVFYMVTNGTMVSVKPWFRETWFKRVILGKGTQFVQSIRNNSNIHNFWLQNHSYGKSVTKSSYSYGIWKNIKESLIKNHSAAQPATRNLHCLVIWRKIKELTLLRNHSVIKL